MTLSQCDLLSLLLQYLFSKATCNVDEPALLHSLACAWAAREKELEQTLRPLYASYCQALAKWMDMRLKTSHLQTMFGTRPHARSSDMVQQLLALNDIRACYMKWKASGVRFEGRTLASEDLLCGVFALVTNTKGTESLFKEGLQKLDEDTFKVKRLDNLSISIYS